MIKGKAFVYPDFGDDSTAKPESEEEKHARQIAVMAAARRAGVPNYRPHGGLKGGVGFGRIVHKGTIHAIK